MNEINEIHPSFSRVSEGLKITFDVTTYRHMLAEYGDNLLDAGKEEYISQLPRYLIAQCPICDKPYYAAFDTHSLKPNMFYPPNFSYLFRSDSKEKKCGHFVAVARFINLNGFMPKEYTRWHNRLGDIPVVTPGMLSNNFEYAVIHGLPICRIEDDVFIPRYSVYFVTYYSRFAHQTIKERREELANLPNIDNDLLEFLDGSFLGRMNPLAKDLSYWVKEEKLFWLDYQTESLKTSDVDVFPYQNITGRGKSYHYLQKSGWPWKNWFNKDGFIR